MRIKGARNIVPFTKRTEIATSSSKEIGHLANIAGNPLTEFRGLLKHEDNFLDWIDDRHEKIVELKAEVQLLKKEVRGKGPAGAKAATFVKYRWYAEQLVLLEAINAFEAFYKKTFIGLGTILQEFVQPEVMKSVKIEARLLWSITDPVSVPALVFEQCLFHDLDAVDEASEMLIGKKRYNQNSNLNKLADRVRSLRGIFQIRHTMSHNNGLVTDSDAAKFKRLKFDITAKEVIDPSQSQLAWTVFEELRAEAEEFTEWIADATADFLRKCIVDRGLAVAGNKRQQLESLLGSHPCWATVNWS